MASKRKSEEMKDGANGSDRPGSTAKKAKTKASSSHELSYTSTATSDSVCEPAGAPPQFTGSFFASCATSPSLSPSKQTDSRDDVYYDNDRQIFVGKPIHVVDFINSLWRWRKNEYMINDPFLGESITCIDTPIINCRNYVDREVLFEREIYKVAFHEVRFTLHEGCCFAKNHFFFTATPGVGTSVLRSYLVGMQMQTLKQREAGDVQSVIFILASSSHASHGYLLLHVDTLRVRHYVYGSKDEIFKYLNEHDPNKEERRLIHCDLTDNADLSCCSGLCTSNTFVFLYTYPNEKAWSSTLSTNGCVFYLPCWSERELMGLYLSCGMNDVLVQSLRQNQRVSIADESKYSLVTRPVVNWDEKTFLIDNEQYSFDMLRQLIEKEVVEVGPAPLNLFQFTSSDREAYCSELRLMVKRARVEEVCAEAYFSNNAELIRGIADPFLCHSLISLQLIDPSQPLSQHSLMRASYKAQFLSRAVEEVCVNLALAVMVREWEEERLRGRMKGALTFAPREWERRMTLLLGIAPTWFNYTVLPTTPAVLSVSDAEERTEGEAMPDDIERQSEQSILNQSIFAIAEEPFSRFSSTTVKVLSASDFEQFAADLSPLTRGTIATPVSRGRAGGGVDAVVHQEAVVSLDEDTAQIRPCTLFIKSTSSGDTHIGETGRAQLTRIVNNIRDEERRRGVRDEDKELLVMLWLSAGTNCVITRDSSLSDELLQVHVSPNNDRLGEIFFM